MLANIKEIYTGLSFKVIFDLGQRQSIFCNYISKNSKNRLNIYISNILLS